MISPSQLESISTADFAMFGLNQVAYVKRAVINGVSGYSIHAADGTPIAAVADRAVAFATIRQNDLEPVDAQ